MSKFEVRDDRNLGIAFIHSVLDEYGLDTYEFRIYCHIARRAGKSKKTEDKGCWESIANIAKNCKINIKTARKSLAFLEDRKLVNVEKRTGYTSLIILNSVEDWLPCDRSTPVKNGSPTKSGTTKSGRGVLPNQEGLPLPNQEGLPLPNQEGLPLPNQVHEVNPYEITPYEVNPIEVNPNKLNTPLTPQGEFCVIQDQIPFSDWEPEELNSDIWNEENQENPDRTSSPLAKSEVFKEPVQLAKISGVETFSAAEKKSTKPKDLDFNIFCDRWNELKGSWAGCELSRNGTFNPKRLKAFRKAWEEHGDRLMEKFELACEFIRTDKWHLENPYSIDTFLVEGNITKYSDSALKATKAKRSIKDMSYQEVYEEMVAGHEAYQAAKLTELTGVVA